MTLRVHQLSGFGGKRAVELTGFDRYGTVGLDLDASDITTMWTTHDQTTQVASDGDTVGAWLDKSSNGILFTNGSGGPVYKTSIVNGEPVVRFSSTFLSKSSYNCQNIFGTNNETTLFFVLQDTGGGYTTSMGVNVNDYVGTTLSWTDGTMYFDASYPGARTSVTEPSGYSDDFRIVMCRRDGDTDATIRVDGTDVVVNTVVSGTTGSGAGTAIMGSYFGAAYPYAGDIARHIVYKGALSSTDIDNVESDLNDIYSIF